MKAKITFGLSAVFWILGIIAHFGDMKNTIDFITTNWLTLAFFAGALVFAGVYVWENRVAWRKKQVEAFKNEALNDIRPAVSEALKIARETQNQEKDYVPEWVRENLIELETRQMILVDLLNKDRQEEGKELLNLRPDDT